MIKPIISLRSLLIVDSRNEKVDKTRKPRKAAYDIVFMQRIFNIKAEFNKIRA